METVKEQRLEVNRYNEMVFEYVAISLGSSNQTQELKIVDMASRFYIARLLMRGLRDLLIGRRQGLIKEPISSKSFPST